MRNLVFLTHDDVRSWGSNLARSEQMAQLSLRILGTKKWNISYTSDVDIRNSIIVMHKGFLERTNLEKIEKIKAAGNVLVADYIDIFPKKEQSQFLDAFLASSHAQAAYLKENFSAPVFHVTQRVDPRFPPLKVKMERFASAYFGDPGNMKFRSELSSCVDVISTPTDNVIWMNKLSEYNFHYGVRESRPWDGFKPFGKGFIAARYGSPIMVSTFDQDAEFYLGSDYPYLLHGDSLDEVSAALTQAKDDFLGPRWMRALDILKDVRSKSTDEFLMNEFKFLIDYFATP